jgi:hypothetical protein
MNKQNATEKTGTAARPYQAPKIFNHGSVTELTHSSRRGGSWGRSRGNGVSGSNSKVS